MLTRRDFAGFASCAICAVTGFIATEVSAQGTPPAGTPGVTRKILSQMDGPMPGYVTINTEAKVDAGSVGGAAYPPGNRIELCLEGGFELPIQGQPTRMLKAGDGYPNSGRDAACWRQAWRQEDQVAITYVVEKGKPLASASLIGARIPANSFGKTSKSEAALVGGLLPFQTSGAMAAFGKGGHANCARICPLLE